MRELLQAGFDKRYVLVPLLAALALVLSAFFVAEARRGYIQELSEVIQERQDRLRAVAELIYACLEAESAQRGYMLTGEAKYAAPYGDGRATAFLLVADLMQRYSTRDSEELEALRFAETQMNSKFDEMDVTLRMMKEGQARDALAAVKTDVGLRQMRDIRDELEGLRTRERARIYEGLAKWRSEVRVNSVINGATTLFTLSLLILVGLLTTREIQRRQSANETLDRLVKQRTAELQDLSAHMVRMGELEKASLARELHDELGGLLVAVRMDLAQLRRRITLPDDDSLARWARVDAALTAGVELKRRVIEELRPTLLDNMGLVAALRWQAEQTSAQGKLELETSLPEEEPTLSDDEAIAVFRCAQEALTNVLKHARATRVRLSMQDDSHGLVVAVEDDGVGLQPGAAQRPGSHGLKQMNFRMQAVGGSMRTETALPRGTRTILRLPA
jgi:signal transduction histidine kinase